MVKFIVKVLCLVGFHSPRPGTSRAWSLSWECQGCHQVLPGELAIRVRRRRSEW